MTAPSPPTLSRLKCWLKKCLKIAVAVYIGLAIVLYFLQSWMIFPGHATQGTAEAHVRPGPDQELIPLSVSTGERTYLLFAPALDHDGSPRPDAAHRPTILYFYGNAMSLSACYDELYKFRRLGANVAIAEFVGYGMATGKPSERGVYATADAAYDYLLTRSDIDAKQIVAAGWSLGAAAAIDLASRKPVAGLATFSAFTSMPEMANNLLPYFPTSLLLRHRFDNLSKIPHLTCPLFLSHGTRDSLVPYVMNARLAAAATAPAMLVPVDGGDHNDIFQIGGPPLLRQFGDFLDRIHEQNVQ